ncbi:hypothetical protein [Escherichia coli]
MLSIYIIYKLIVSNDT